MKIYKWLLIILCIEAAILSVPAQKPVPKKSPNQTNPNQQWQSFSCILPKGLLIAKESYRGYNRAKALQTRTKISTQNPEWITRLPCCPETYSYTQEASMWETSTISFAGCFHPGAYYDVRTSQVYHQVTNTSSGQQCTYTRQGNLISRGAGAGTPDFVSPNVNAELHYINDVYPWTFLTLAEYNSTWKPDVGCNQSSSYRFTPNKWLNAWMYVKRGDVIAFTDAMGKVQFDVEGNTTGPEGSTVMPKTQIGLLGRVLYTNPIPTAPSGALIGAVYQGSFIGTGNNVEIDLSDMTAGFLIGRGAIVTIEAEGYLMLGINDGFIENNSGWFEVNIQRSKHK
ncbi:MAG TPA: hypothetical protein VGB00_17035 [Pyrinomonadaceae bacterium]|jgi:hypothetical protein